jgi:hypothetical protein
MIHWQFVIIYKELYVDMCHYHIVGDFVFKCGIESGVSLVL